MKNNKSVISHDIYYENLEVIRGVRFTPREIDIIACLLSGKGTKTVAQFLSIEEKTVETHKYNVMRKLECNSKESIIEFVEKSDKFSSIKQHYLELLTRETFEKNLREILKLLGKNTPICSLIYWREQEKKTPFISQVVKHLKLAGVKILTEIRENHKSINHLIHHLESKFVEYIIYDIPHTMIIQLQADEGKGKAEIFPFIQKLEKKPGSVTFILRDTEATITIPQVLHEIEYINIEMKENYYLSVLNILQKLCPIISLEKIILGFQKQYDVIQGSSDKALPQLWPEVNELQEKKNSIKSVFPNFFLERRALSFVVGSILLTGLCIFFGIVNKYEPAFIPSINQAQDSSIRSDLPIPQNDMLLERPKLITQMNKKLMGEQGIQTLALIGIGGAGKTTLARQYARTQKSSAIWEINAETKGSLIGSFENLAYVLSKSEEEKKILRSLQDIKDSKEREEKLIQLVKQHLKLRPNWFLVFDNVEKFADIQNYFPSDHDVWGKGKVIVTTRDSTIQNHSYITNAIEIGELDPKEKLNFFMKIMKHGSPSSPNNSQNEKDTHNFLQAIPPFPLDISIAAYYLKLTQIPYKTYLDHLNQSHKDFENVQEKILKEAGNYAKTRYNIVTLSLKQFINIDGDFKYLLLFLSILDSQEIPRDLLDLYTNNITVDNFIYNLKKCSLITTNNRSSSMYLLPSLSIHRSTQTISLHYLSMTLNLKERDHAIQKIINSLESYTIDAMDKEDHSRIKMLINHYNSFLNHHDLLTDNLKSVLKSQLGSMYASLGQYMKAVSLLKESLNILNKLDRNSKSNIKLAWILARLGNTYRNLGDYKKAKDFLEQSITIYQNNPQNHVEMAQTLAYLGNLYRCMGDYNRARAMIEQSINLYIRYFPKKSIKLSGSLVYLGNIHRKLGQHEKARYFIEQGLTIYKKHFFEGHRVISWASTHLGIAYIGLGNYEKAKSLLEKSFAVSKEHFPENHIYIGWVLEYLGVAYKGLRNYEKSKEALKKSLIIHEKNYGKNHIETARVLNNLGEVYILENSIEIAEGCINRALAIFQQDNHPEAYICFENLSELNLKKCNLSQKNEKQRDYRNTSLDYLYKSLEIVEKNFTKNSPYYEEIVSKISKLKGIINRSI